MSEPTDKQLVRACLDGKSESFGVLVDRYQRPIYNAVLRMVREDDDAKDLTQTAFINAYENLEKFDPGHAFFSWLYRIATNATINFLNRKKFQEPLSDEHISDQKNPQEIHSESQLSDKIQRSLMELTMDHRMVIVLRHFVDFTYSEMSEILKIPEKTVKSRLFSARKNLSEILTECGITSAIGN